MTEMCLQTADFLILDLKSSPDLLTALLWTTGMKQSRVHFELPAALIIKDPNISMNEIN